MSTTIPKAAEVARAWYIIDAKDQVLGRLATRIATVIRGKHKVDWAPHVDNGDFVIVLNADKIQLTGRKLDQKHYHQYSGHPGGLRSRSARDLLGSHPDRLIRFAVQGMLPKNRLSRSVITKLKIYAGGTHPHEAQQPQPFPDTV